MYSEHIVERQAQPRRRAIKTLFFDGDSWTEAEAKDALLGLSTMYASPAARQAHQLCLAAATQV